MATAYCHSPVDFTAPPPLPRMATPSLIRQAIEYLGILCKEVLAAVSDASRSVVACRARKDQKAQAHSRRHCQKMRSERRVPRPATTPVACVM